SGLGGLLWLPWRGLARRLSPASADTLLGFFGPFALLFQLVVWTLGIMLGYSVLEWAVVGGSFSTRVLSSSGVFLSAEGPSGSTAGHVIGLLEAATGVGVVFIVIGYLPAVYAAFVKATAPEGKVVAADVTHAIGRHALADLTTQYGLAARPADRLTEREFDHLYEVVETATDDAVERGEAMERLAELRSAYEPN